MSEARSISRRGLAARNGGRLGLAALAVILLLGLGLRVDYAWEGRDPVFDAEAYGRIAASLAEGGGFTIGTGATQPAGNYSPGLPLFVAAVYELTGGEHERFARLVLSLVGSLAVLFTYLIGRRLAGPFAGLFGAAIVAIYPALLEYQGMLMGEPLATTLLSGAILAFLWAAGPAPGRPSGGWRGARGAEDAPARNAPLAPRQDPPARWLVPGLLFGALALVRPEYLGVALVLALVVFAIGARDDRRRAATHVAVLLAGVVLVVAPWTIRNAVELDRFVPVSTGGGQVLFAGSYLPSGGDPERVGREVLERHPGLARKLARETLPSVGHEPDRLTLHRLGERETVDLAVQRLRLEQILAALAEQRYPGMETDRALARMGRERLWDDLTESPLDYAGFVAAKLWNLWGRGPREVMERPGWEVLHWALLALAALGTVVLIARRRSEALPMLVVLLVVTATSAVLVASPRRVLVMLPIVAALAGVGATACRDSLARRWRH